MAEASVAVSSAVTEVSPDKRRTKERGIDDYKRKIWKLKKELEEQREASLALQNEELTKLRQTLIEGKEQEIAHLKLETRRDLIQMHEKFAEKEGELTRTVKSRDEQIRALNKQIGGHAHEVKGVKSAIESAHHDTVTRFQREIKQLKTINQDLQQKYQTKQQDYKDKQAELRAVQDGAEADKQKLLKDALTAKLTKLKQHQDSGGKVEHVSDRVLQNKVTELTVALKRSEKRTGALKEENTNLRKADANYKDLEEHCAKLKRRNAELASAVKTSGDKNKTSSTGGKKLNTSIVGGDNSPADSTQALDHAKKLFARQRAKDFAEHARVLLTKDKEIEKLTKKTLSLSDSMSNHTRQLTLQSQFDMTTALRQSTKEKILLEMKSSGPGGDDSEARASLFNLQVDYDSLQDRYDILLNEKVLLDKEIEEFRGRIGEIEQELGKARKEKITLQEERETKERKCVQLIATNNNLTKERQHLSDTVDKMTEEIAILKHENKSSLRQIERLTEGNNTLTEEITRYEEKGLTVEELQSEKQQLAEELDNIKQQAHESEMESAQLKDDNSTMSTRVTELLDKNQEQGDELTELKNTTLPRLIGESEELKSSVLRLELKASDLAEEKEELQTRLNDQEDQTTACEQAKLENMSLTEELSELREKMEKDSKSAIKTQTDQKTSIENLESQVKDLNTQVTELDENRLEAQRRIEKLKTDFKLVLETKDSELDSLKEDNLQLEEQASMQESKIDELAESLSQALNQVSLLETDLSLERSKHNNDLETSVQLKGQVDDVTQELDSLKQGQTNLEKQLTESKSDLKTKIEEIESLKIKTEQSEQKLKEHESMSENKVVETEQLASQLSQVETDLQTQIEKTEKLEKCIVDLEDVKLSLESEREKLNEQIDKKENEKNSLSDQISKLALDLERLQSTHLDSSALVESAQVQYDEQKLKLQQLQQKYSELEDSLKKSKQQLSESRKQREALESHAKRKLLSLKQDLTSSFDGKIEKLNQTLEESQQTNDNLRLELDEVKAELEEHNIKQISVYAGDNCYHLYVVRHAYDPSLLNDSSDSPLSSPHKSADRSGADSALSATERLTDISVNPGDYVFVSGELTEEGFYEGHLLDGRAGLIPSNVLEPLYEFDIYGFVLASEPDEVEADEPSPEMSTFNSTAFNDSSLLPSTPRPAAPYPRSLTLERQFANGILVGWDSPEGGETVFLYKIYIDDKLKVSISGRNKNKALVEGVKAMIPHRVCVSATTSIGESDRRHCTMMIGEPNHPPSDLSVSAVNSETASITFLPHNTNRHHVVWVNEEKVRNLSPSLFQVEIAGLLNQTEYQITVTSAGATEIASLTSPHDSKLSVSTQFTMPSADEIANASGDGLDPGFLKDGGTKPKEKKFDEFLDVVVNGSPIPSVIPALDAESDPVLEDVDFLRTYDASLPSTAGHPTNHSTRPFSPSQLTHSTPKPTQSHSRLLHIDTKLENEVSPIVYSETLTNNNRNAAVLSPSSQNNKKSSNSHSRSNGVTSPQDKAGCNSNGISSVQLQSDSNSSITQVTPITSGVDSESTVTIGGSESTPLNAKSPEPESKPISVLSDDFPSSRSEKSNKEEKTLSSITKNSRASPLQNKQSLQKMLKSLASKLKPQDKQPSPSRNSKSTDKEEAPSAGTAVDPIETTPSRTSSASHSKRREKSSSSSSTDKQRHKRSSSEKSSSVKTAVVTPRTSTQPPLPTGLMEVDDQRLKLTPRSFRAIYDYLPATMSPNKESANEELTFHAGDIINVYGDKDRDEFYLGQIGDRYGHVPSNMVEEFTFEQEDLAGNEKRVRALYDYDPSKLSPNEDPDNELKFKAGDVIIVSGEIDTDGFYKGYIAGKSVKHGLVPSNYLQEIASNSQATTP